MTSELSRQRAAQAWCTPTTSHIEMNSALAEAFAEILDEIWAQPWLGNATTRELLDEVKARVNLDYRTVGEPSGELKALMGLPCAEVTETHS